MRYVLQGERKSAKLVDYKLEDYNQARFEFGCLKEVCSWITLYQDNNGRLKQLKVYVRE